MAEPRVTIWLQSSGYEDGEWTPDKTPPRKFEVVKTQNTITPGVGDRISTVGAQALIDQGVTVNFS